MIGRPKIKNKKKNISLSINIELDKFFSDFVKEKKVTKSEYVEYLLKKEMSKMVNSGQVNIVRKKNINVVCT